MESASEAHCANLVRPSVVHIMEEHLIPALASSDGKGHDVVENWPRAVRIVCKEVVPWKRVVEVCDQDPCKAIATSSCNGDRKHKPPALSQVEVIGNGANQPHTCPEAPNKGVVLDAAREPLAPELFVALSTICLIREMAPPFKCEEHACIVEAEEVEHWNQRHREHQAIPLVGPLLEPVLELFRIPPEFSLNQQVHSTGMVPVVFKNELLPRQRNEVSKRMSDVLLPFEWRKCCTVHDIMVNIDMLDGYVDEAHEEDNIDE
mmetsp:Transcript_55835/g.102352  ORF Transcript_55835/g.102352 Transcript_55835/m.102352 type:complete len:262 (-) Transcript_55835:265-1050(-)